MATQPNTPQPSAIHSATLSMTLKTDSGFRSKTTAQRISLDQWTMINLIVAADPSVSRAIYDQNDKPVGKASTPVGELLFVSGYVDDKGTVWTPATAYAYYTVCQALRRKDARILELTGEAA